MKRVDLIITLLLSAIICSAKEVPQRVAEGIAKSFFDNSPATKSDALSIVLLWDGLELGPSTKSYSKTPPFYVYGIIGGAGFVVVSGDDICRPVLAYSYDHSFDPDDIPDAMRDWFEMTRAMINHADKNGLSPTSSVMAQWAKMTSSPGKAGSYEPIKKLETALWDQSYPYFKKSPVLWDVSSLPTYTGCTNTATTIVMKYWEHPEAGRGTLEGYDYYSDDERIPRHIDGHVLGHRYRWDDMLMSYDDECTDAQADAVSTLMYDLGIMNYTNWGYTGSGAHYHVDAYIDNMGYDKSALLTIASDFGMDEWHTMLHKEIDEGRPVLYTGDENTESGHSFVLDGYASNNYYSVNWGWGGLNNGFFTIDPSMGNDDLMVYCLNQRAVLGMKPDDGEDEPFRYPFKCAYISSSLPVALYYGDDTFTVEGRFYTTYKTRVGVANTFCVALMNGDSIVKLLSEAVEHTFFDSYKSFTTDFVCDIPAGLKEGDYLSFCYLDADGNWKQYPGTKFAVSEEKPLSSGLSVSVEGNTLQLMNISKASIIVLKDKIVKPGSAAFYYDVHDQDMKVIICDCFHSYELIIKL